MLAHIGAQLRQQTVNLARRAVNVLEVMHSSSICRTVQPEGDRDWRGFLAQIARAARRVGVPIVDKEVGSGLSASMARALVEVGVAVIDVAGAGGTSWAAVGARARDDADRAVAMEFSDWGIPTPASVQAVRRALPAVKLVAWGGIPDGVDVAKAIGLGADCHATENFLQNGLESGLLRDGRMKKQRFTEEQIIGVLKDGPRTGKSMLGRFRRSRPWPDGYPQFQD